MSRQLSITLPVADVAKSQAFFEALGFPENAQFCGEGAACIVISETVFVMLLSHARFTGFSPKPPCDTAKAVEALFGIGCESREQVDDLVARARAAGGTVHEEAVDYGFLYHGSFADLDGHLWALNYMSGPPPRS